MHLFVLSPETLFALNWYLPLIRRPPPPFNQLLLSCLYLCISILDGHVNLLLLNSHLPLLLLDLLAFTLKLEDPLSERIERLKQLIPLITHIKLLFPDLILSGLQFFSFVLQLRMLKSDLVLLERDHRFLVFLDVHFNLFNFVLVSVLKIGESAFSSFKGLLERFQLRLLVSELALFELQVRQVLRVDLLVKLELLLH